MIIKRDSVKNLTDDEMDRLLVDGQVSEEVLGRYLARLRDIGVAGPEPEVVDRHLAAITSEVERLGDRRPAVSGRPLSTRIRLTATGMLVTFRRRVAPRNVMTGFAAAVMTAGMAAAATGNLPAPAQDLISKSLAQVGIEIPPPEFAPTELADVGQGQDSADSPTIAEPTVPDENRFGVVPATQPEPSVGGLDNPAPSVETPPVAPDESGTAVVEPPNGQPGVGPPANPGPPENTGPPANPGPPENAGPPAEPGKPQSQSREGNGSG